MAVDLYHRQHNAQAAQGYLPWCRLCVCDEMPKIANGYALWLDHLGLALLSAAHAKPFRLTADSLDARNPAKSLLAKACGAVTHKPSIVDPFAGFGMDALLLTKLGCKMTAIEQQPIVWLMLRGFAADLGLNIDSHCGDGTTWLADASQPENAMKWDVVYLDPMFPQRRKRALPNLGLQLLQDLAADVLVDLGQCIQLGQQCANQRVVVKRRLKDPVVSKPAHQIKGHSIRFDVYL